MFSVLQLTAHNQTSTEYTGKTILHYHILLKKMQKLPVSRMCPKQLKRERRESSVVRLSKPPTYRVREARAASASTVEELGVEEAS